MADSNGRLRSSANTRDLADATGRCLHPADIGCTVDTRAREGRRRCRAESPGVPASSRSSSRYGTCLLARFHPRPPHRLKQAPDICFLGDPGQAGADSCGTYRRGPAPPPPTMTRPGEEPSLLPIPTEEESRWISGCAGRFGAPRWRSAQRCDCEASPWLARTSPRHPGAGEAPVLGVLDMSVEEWVNRQLAKFPALTEERWTVIAAILAAQRRPATGRNDQYDRSA